MAPCLIKMRQIQKHLSLITTNQNRARRNHHVLHTGRETLLQNILTCIKQRLDLYKGQIQKRLSQITLDLNIGQIQKASFSDNNESKSSPDKPPCTAYRTGNSPPKYTYVYKTKVRFIQRLDLYKGQIQKASFSDRFRSVFLR